MNEPLLVSKNLETYLRGATPYELADVLNALLVEFTARGLPGMVQLQRAAEQLDVIEGRPLPAEQSPRDDRQLSIE